MFAIKNIDQSRLKVYLADRIEKLNLIEKDEVKIQAGLLQGDLVKGADPLNLAASQKKARVRSQKSFYTIPRPGHGLNDIFKGVKRGKPGGQMIWLFSSTGVLVGVNKRHDKTGLTAQQIMELNILHKKTEGFPYRDLGRHGHQKVIDVNKWVVKESQFKQFLKLLSDSFGKLKASFAHGSETIGAKYRLPNWVKKHIKPNNGSFVNRIETKTPSFTIISYASGSESEASKKNISRAVIKRAESMKKDMENQLNGKYKRESPHA